MSKLNAKVAILSIYYTCPFLEIIIKFNNMLVKNIFQKKLSFEIFGKALSLRSGEITEVDDNLGKILIDTPWIIEIKPKRKQNIFKDFDAFTDYGRPYETDIKKIKKEKKVEI